MFLCVSSLEEIRKFGENLLKPAQIHKEVHWKNLHEEFETGIEFLLVDLFAQVGLLKSNSNEKNFECCLVFSLKTATLDCLNKEQKVAIFEMKQEKERHCFNRKQIF